MAVTGLRESDYRSSRSLSAFLLLGPLIEANQIQEASLAHEGRLWFQCVVILSPQDKLEPHGTMSSGSADLCVEIESPGSASVNSSVLWKENHDHSVTKGDQDLNLNLPARDRKVIWEASMAAVFGDYLPQRS